MHILIGKFTDFFLAGGLHYKHQFVQALMPFMWLLQFASLPHWKSQAPLKAIKASCRPRKVEKAIKMWNRPAEVEKSKNVEIYPKIHQQDSGRAKEEKATIAKSIHSIFPTCSSTRPPVVAGPTCKFCNNKKGHL